MPFNHIRETRKVSHASREQFLSLEGVAGAVFAGHNVSLAGISELSGPYEIVRLEPPFHVVLFTLAGAGQLETEAGLMRMRAGSLAILPAGSKYRYTRASGVWKIAWFHLRRRRTWRALEDTPPRVVPSHVGEELAFALRRCMAPGNEPRTERREQLCAELALEILGAEIEQSGNASSRDEEELLRKLFAEVSSRLSEKWTVARLSKLAHMSNATLHRATLRVFGASPMVRTTALRMERADLLLRHTSQSVAQIAAEVGYENQFAFSTAFSRRYGISPSHARRKNSGMS